MPTHYTFDDLLLEILGLSKSPIDARGTPRFEQAVAGQYGAIPRPKPAAPAPGLGAVPARDTAAIQGQQSLHDMIRGLLPTPKPEEQVPPPAPILGVRG